MTLQSKRLQDVTEADLASLMERGVAEGREVDYKISLPGNSDGDKKEFLYDISSFANCIGGDLVFGMRESQGIPVEKAGLQIRDVDAEKQRLENLIRDGIQPRIIPSVSVQPIILSNSSVVLIVRIPRSLAQPHAVTLGGSYRFYSRNSAGKYPLDIGEVRNAFLGSQQIAEHTRSFRMDRIALITANEGPMGLPNSGKMIVHIIPFRAFDPGFLHDVTSLERERFATLKPMGNSADGFRYNLDGLLSYANHGYLQVFRSGIIEAVDTSFHVNGGGGQQLIPGFGYEERLIEAIKRFLALQRLLSVEPPLSLMVTLSGVKGYRMGVSSEFSFDEGVPIDRDLLIISEVIIEDLEANVAQVLRPIFDAMWNAAGWPRSRNYDETGNWRRYR